jgi:hypothetical protein
MPKALLLWLFCFCFGVAQSLSPLPKSKHLYDVKVVQAFDLEALKPLWKERVAAIKATGELPLIDIESSFNPQKFNPIAYAKEMDKLGVALIAFSPQVEKKAYEEHDKTWDDSPHALMQIDPYRYVPTTTAGIDPVWTKEPLDFAKESISRAIQEHYPLLGEFEFRHYPSPRQIKRKEFDKDVTIPIDSPAAHLLFQFSEQTHIPFQIHYEIEDALLPPLEKMLQTYPKARVLWCHLAQIRYHDRTKRYNASYVRELIERYPNLYFDLAFGDADSTYPPSKEHHATMWDQESKTLKPEWKQLIEEYPYRFLIAFDIGGDRHDALSDKVRVARNILSNLSPKVQEIVAYKAFWRLLFVEEIK